MKKHIKAIIGIGVFCVCFVIAAVWYANTYNDGRIVKPMDYSSYVFTPKDLPMIISLLMIITFFICIFIWVVYTIVKNRTNQALVTKTRKLNPKLGLLGFFGFLGFGGFWAYDTSKQIFPFAFFVFFGFFSFFFEGKMSDTLIDERFKENDSKAQLISHRLGFFLIWMALIIIGRGSRFLENLEHVAIAYTIAISLITAFTMVLSKFLLYRYDMEERVEE